MPRAPTKSLAPYWTTADGNLVRLYLGNVVEVLRQLPAKSIHCVVTSPPYWGLRDYGTGEWVGGDSTCDHTQIPTERPELRLGDGKTVGCLSWGSRDVTGSAKNICPKCGA